MTGQPLGAYAEFEGSVARLRAHLEQVVATLRATYAAGSDSTNHRTEVQVGLLAELMGSEPAMLATLLVVAMDKLAGCTGIHMVPVDESSVEDWEWK